MIRTSYPTGFWNAFAYTATLPGTPAEQCDTTADQITKGTAPIEIPADQVTEVVEILRDEAAAHRRAALRWPDPFAGLPRG